MASLLLLLLRLVYGLDVYKRKLANISVTPHFSVWRLF